MSNVGADSSALKKIPIGPIIDWIKKNAPQILDALKKALKKGWDAFKAWWNNLAVTTAMLVLAASAAVAVVVAVGLGLLLGRPLTWTGLDESAPLLVSGSLVGVLVGAALGAALKNAIAAIALSFRRVVLRDDQDRR